MNITRIVWTGPGHAELHEAELPAPSSGQVLLETAYSLISPGTEREWLRDDSSHAVLGTSFPFTPGYSAAGRIAAVADDVADWAVGDPVVVLGPPTGAHASHQLVPAATLMRVPDGMSLDRAVFYQLGGTALHTVRLASLGDAKSVGIVGQGPIGQIALQATHALHPSCLTFALDLDPQRLATAGRLGAQLAVDPRDAAGMDAAVARLGGGTEAAIDLSGAREGMNTAVRISGPLGRVVLSTGADGESPLSYGQVFAKGLTLVGAFVGARPADFGADTGLFLDLVAQGAVSVDHLLGEQFSPAEAGDVYHRIGANDRGLTAPIFTWG